jgi:site-specific recombinase XerD
MTTELVIAPSAAPVMFDRYVPQLVLQAGPKATESYINFFTADIPNENTRAAYLWAVRRFAEWCSGRGVSLLDVRPFMVAAYREELKGKYHPQSIKQHFAAIRGLFDRMVVDQVLPVNPAASVRGPKYSTKEGKTPILDAEETRRLFNSFDTSHIVGLRDRALTGVLVYACARVSAVIAMKGKDFFPSGRRWKVGLHEKGGKYHEVPCQHDLEEYLHAYIEVAGIEKEKEGPLFRSVAGKTRVLTANPMHRVDVNRMIKRRAKEAGVSEAIGCHSFRGTGITLFMANGGRLERAQELANHADSRTTRLYDRTNQRVTLDEVELIRF